MTEHTDGTQRHGLDFHEISERPPQGPQADSLIRLARRCLPEFRAYPELIEEKLFPTNRGPEESLVICTHGDSVIAAASFDFHVVQERRIGGVRTILVDPQYRRRGVGTRLIETVERSIGRREGDRIWLYCSVPNYLYPGAPGNDLAIAGFASKLGYSTRVPTRDIGVDLLRLRRMALTLAAEAGRRG